MAGEPGTLWRTGEEMGQIGAFFDMDRTVLAGSQTGAPEDYAELRRLCDPGTLIVDDLTAPELVRFLASGTCDLLIGGVKERPIAYKLGVAFCDHNHERKHALNGFQGMLAFARELDATVNSPVWSLIPHRRRA